VNLMWNTSVLLPGFVMSPVTVLAGPVLSYNVLITAAPALNTTFAYLAFRRWTFTLPALVGALAFGFSPSVATQSIGHLAQVLLMSAPLMLIMLDRLLVTQTSRFWRDGLLLGALAWAQLLTGEEVLAMEAIGAVIGVAVLCAINRDAVRSHLQYALRGLVVAAGSFVVLAAPFLAEQYDGPYRVQDVHPPNLYVSDLFNFFTPTNMTQLAPKSARLMSFHFTGNGSEEGAYIGIPFLVLLVLACALARRHKITWVGLSVAAGMGLLSMGQTLHVAGHVTSFPLPDNLLQKLPIFHNLLPDRLASMMFLGVGLVLALGLDELWRVHVSLKVAGWGLAALGLAAVCPLIDYPASASPPLAAFNTGWVCPQRPPGSSGQPPAVLIMPAIDELALRWQSEADFCFTMPTASGTTGTNSYDIKAPPLLVAAGNPKHPGSLPPITPSVRAEAAAELQQLGVTEIVVAPWYPAVPVMTAAQQADLVAWLTQLLGQPPVQDGAAPSRFAVFLWADLPSPASIAAGK
jgi:hypothetical protein